MNEALQLLDRRFGHPLGYVRFVRGWSATALLEAIADVADAQGGVRMSRTDRGKVHRWESGGAAPNRQEQRALAGALSVPLGRLTTHPWPWWLPAFGGVRRLQGWSPVHTAQALADALAGAADRRDYLGLTGRALVADADPWTAARPPVLTTVVRGPLTVSEDAVAALEGQARLLRTLDGTVPARIHHEVATGQLRLALELLTRGRRGPHGSRRTYRAAAQHAVIAGWAAYDTGRQLTAQRHFRAALHAAHTTDDRVLGGYLLACLGYQAVVLGEPASGLRLADQAVRVAQGCASGRARRLLAGYRGVAQLAAGIDLAAVQAGIDGDGGGPAAPTGDPFLFGWFDDRAASPRRYVLACDGHSVRLAPLIGQPVRRAAEPVGSVVRTHRQLHRLAERLACARTTARAAELPEQVRALRLAAAA